MSLVKKDPRNIFLLRTWSLHGIIFCAINTHTRESLLLKAFFVQNSAAAAGSAGKLQGGFRMKKTIIMVIVTTALCSFLSVEVSAEKAHGQSGAELFKTHCAVCHPDGGNIVNPDYTLRKKDRDKHNVKTASDIIAKMRNPGPGMTPFDKATISDDDAEEIAEYILKTFK
jgi:cytochrome c6